jgi:hypothetical protein
MSPSSEQQFETDVSHCDVPDETKLYRLNMKSWHKLMASTCSPSQAAAHAAYACGPPTTVAPLAAVQV